MEIPSADPSNPKAKTLNLKFCKPSSDGHGALDGHDDVFADEMLVAWILSLKGPQFSGQVRFW